MSVSYKTEVKTHRTFLACSCHLFKCTSNQKYAGFFGDNLLRPNWTSLASGAWKKTEPAWFGNRSLLFTQVPKTKPRLWCNWPTTLELLLVLIFYEQIFYVKEFSLVIYMHKITCHQKTFFVSLNLFISNNFHKGFTLIANRSQNTTSEGHSKSKGII